MKLNSSVPSTDNSHPSQGTISESYRNPIPSNEQSSSVSQPPLSFTTSPLPEESISHPEPEFPTIITHSETIEEIPQKSSIISPQPTPQDKPEEKPTIDVNNEWDEDEVEPPSQPPIQQPIIAGPPPVKKDTLSFFDLDDDDTDPFFKKLEDPLGIPIKKKDETISASKSSNPLLNGTSTAPELKEKEKKNPVDFMSAISNNQNDSMGIFGSTEKTQSKSKKSTFVDNEEEDDFLNFKKKDPLVGAKNNTTSKNVIDHLWPTDVDDLFS